MRTGFGGTSADPTGGGDEMRQTATTEPAPVAMGGGIRIAQPGGQATAKSTTAPVSMGGGGGGSAGTTFTGQGRTGEEALGGGVQDPTPVDK